MAHAPAELVVERPEGLYCPAGDFFIDPWRPVDRAVITHAHADHARGGHRHYLCSAEGAGVLKARLGQGLPLQALRWGESVEHHGVRLSLHPAGHVLGSAQVRLEHGGQVWVASGDYKVAPDPTCTPFEPVRCDTFITESTFGLPVYHWPDDRRVMGEINAWWQANARAGQASVLLGYSFGKTQRILAGLDPAIGPIVVHQAVETMNAAYRASGIALPPTTVLHEDLPAADRARALVLVPPGALGTEALRRYVPQRCAFASGWMRVRAMQRRRGHEHGFVLSDHADWPGLLQAITATDCTRVIVTHGFEAPLVRWLRQRGLDAGRFRTAFGGEADEHAAEEPVREAADAATGAEIESAGGIGAGAFAGTAGAVASTA